MQSTLKAALEYAEQGFRVLPLKPGSKIPDLRHWPEEASNDPDTVRRHWAQSQARGHEYEGQPNIGLCTGGGLAVLDVDTNHGGVRPEWAPRTWTVKTPSGGYHLYYAVSTSVPNSVGRLAKGVDVRGERGQVAAPPSVLVGRDGRAIGRYREDVDAPIALIDSELLIPDDLKVNFAGAQRRFDYRDEVPVGERNNYLTSLAGYLFATGQSPSEVLAALRTEVDTLGFSPRPDEVELIVKSVSRYH
jgi:hypothetical protein